MNRSDLHSTFTKINLWKLLQFRRIVYIDADMVALRAPDELFNIPQPFSAAPDIGWPDLFNSGLMVLSPNMGDYFALLAMAQRGISFDGADQGLLNMHFKNTYNRISFTYNVTPSAHYQYLPAYKHFQSSVSMAHFIGQNKPWNEGRDAHKGTTPYDEMVGRWWAVYDRHFRESVSTRRAIGTHHILITDQSVNSSATGVSPILKYHTKGEYQPPGITVLSPPAETGTETFHPASKVQGSHPAVEEPSPEVHTVEVQKEEVAEVPPVVESPYSTWDASRAPPPSDSRPEAANFPSTHYNMSSDPTPFKAPERYPEPPQGMYYEVPKTPTYQKPAPIFPWEKNAPKPTRVFPEDEPVPDHPGTTSASTTEDEQETVTPTSPTFRITPADPWQTFTRGNAWDDIPEIERYIGNLQKNRKGNIQVLQGYGSGIDQISSPGAERRRSMKLTDFPTELERPSLPVTPAPIRRPSFWGEERDEEGELPAAEGVPTQADWVSACSATFKQQISLLMIHRILQRNWIS